MGPCREALEHSVATRTARRAKIEIPSDGGEFPASGFQFSVRQRGSGATGEGFSRDSRGDVFGGGGWRGMKPPIQMRGCVSGMVESELRSVDVGPTPRQILGFHLRRSVRSADTTACGICVWDFHPQILQMDTDWEVEGGGWKALVPIRSASRPGQFGDRHSCRWSRTASQKLWIHPGTQSNRRATSTGHRRPRTIGETHPFNLGSNLFPFRTFQPARFFRIQQ